MAFFYGYNQVVQNGLDLRTAIRAPIQVDVDDCIDSAHASTSNIPAVSTNDEPTRIRMAEELSAELSELADWLEGELARR